jgi:hypothetical protein
MTKTIIPAKFDGLKKYSIDYTRPVDIQIFGKSYAKAGVLSSEELAILGIDYPNFNVVTHYSQIPNSDRRFLPVIGKTIRDIIGVGYRTYLVIDCSRLIKTNLELSKLVKDSTYYKAPQQESARLISIKILLLRNLELLMYTKLDKDNVVITTPYQILIPDPGPNNREDLQNLIHDSLSTITVVEVLKVFSGFEF